MKTWEGKQGKGLISVVLPKFVLLYLPRFARLWNSGDSKQIGLCSDVPAISHRRSRQGVEMIPRISIFSVVVVVIVCLILLSSTEQGVTAAKASSHHSAAVPKSKSAKSSGFKGVLGGSLIKNFMREAKMSFCSELEGLTLQVSIATYCKAHS